MKHRRGHKFFDVQDFVFFEGVLEIKKIFNREFLIHKTPKLLLYCQLSNIAFLHFERKSNLLV